MVLDLPFSGLRPTTPARFFYWNRDYHWAPPALPDFDLWCILEGRGEVELRGRTHELVPGACFVLRPGDRPRARHDPAYPLMAFYCHFHLLDTRGRILAASRVDVPQDAVAVRDRQWFSALARRCVSASLRSDALGQRQCRLALEQMLALVWEWWQTPPRTTDEAMVRAVERIEREPGLRWDVATLAREAHLSRAQFTRRFKAHTGKPPQAFVIETRLDVARQLVLESEMSLSQIAQGLGYPDLYYFSRQFKQHFARAPSALRGTRPTRRP